MFDYVTIREKIRTGDVQERQKAVIQIVETLAINTDKDWAWKDLLSLTKDLDSDVRSLAANALGSAFQYLTDQDQAWKDLLVLTKDLDSDVRRGAANALGSAFQYLTDQDQAWKDLLVLTMEQDSYVRSLAANALGSVFQYLTDQDQAWKDLLELTRDLSSDVRRVAAVALGSAFPYLPAKDQASKDLLALTKDPDNCVRWRAAGALGSAFQYLTAKDQASKDLLALIKDQDSVVRRVAAYALCSAFQYLTVKDQAWKDLLALTKDRDSYVRWSAAYALCSAFQYLTAKDQASKDLLELTRDREGEVRWIAAYVIGSVFQYLTAKDQAWKVLLTLTKDQHSEVRRVAAVALGSAFQYLTAKDQAWKDLLELTRDMDRNVRVTANYFLGKILVFRATKAKDNDILEIELENAIGFFEISAQEAEIGFNPAKFCLLFYQSYYSVVFEKQVAEEKIKKNLEEAKQEVFGSKSRELLLEAVENLSKALNEAQKLRELDDIKADLNGCRQYCDRACELLDRTEDTAPGATKLIRRGLPVIDERIQGMLTEIRERAEAICRQSVGTQYEGFGKEVHKIGKVLPNVKDLIRIIKLIDAMLIVLAPVCEKMAEIDNKACEFYQMARKEQFVEDKIPLINMILSKIPYHMNDMKDVTIINQAPYSKAYINSEDRSINITGDLHIDLENLKLLIEKEYTNMDKEELVETLNQMMHSPENPSKKKRLKEKLEWIISKTSEFSSISSFALSLLEKIN